MIKQAFFEIIISDRVKKFINKGKLVILKEKK